MDSSLGSNNNEESNTGSTSSIEKEYMFDKVVTPSDVGKLNRLVIPKQHAEKYFPLDSSSTEKGLLLNFEDRNGKSWRFRYSYWNSSQSYVMTKGWSHFVKDKKLDAGDIVSFQRGVGESGKDRLYIDWRRRVNMPDPTSFAHIQLLNQFNFSQSVRWGGLYSLPQSYEPLHRLNFSIYPYNHNHQQQQQQQLLQQQQQQQQQHQTITYGNVAQYYHHHHEIGAVQREEPMVIDHQTAAKRLRLFGVNMDCSTTTTTTTTTKDESSSSSTKHYDSSQFSPTSLQSRLSNKKGKSSLSFDLDL